MGNNNMKLSSIKRSTKHKPTKIQQPASMHRIQNFLLVWLDGNIDNVNHQDSINTICKLRGIVNTVNTFTSVDECVNFISTIEHEKIFIIVSGLLGQKAVPIVHNMPQVDAIYVFCKKRSRHRKWSKEWPKIQGVFTDIKPICDALRRAVRTSERNDISISIVPSNAGNITQNLNELDKSFMYTQILKEILLTIEFEPQHINDFILYFREQIAGNITELKNIDKFADEYHKHVPIWWYTYQCFLFSMLNRALRLMEVELIVNMGFFIRDLHNHLIQLHSEQYNGHKDTFIVYRGQGLSQTDFDQLMNNKDGLLSFNNFLSTSTDRQVSFAFACSNSEVNDLVGILFVIKIDPSINSTPFANVRSVSYYQAEEEILFSMHSIFRIGQVTKIDRNNRLWQVELTLTSDNDPQLHALSDYIRKETYPDQKGWYRLGNLLIKLGQFEKAQQVCTVMLGQKATEHEEANIYHMLGMIKKNQGEYEEAIRFYEKSLEIKAKVFSTTYVDVATYGNMGLVYSKMGEYAKALLSHEKAVEICQNTLPANHSLLATSYNNIGEVYDKMGQYSRALSFFENDLEICQKILPPNHPDLATSYNNIAAVYYNMAAYAKALAFYEKALEIRQKALPSNHPDLASSYNNIGEVYDKMGEYSKALSSHEKALEIWQKTLSPNHPDLATSYNNIAAVYDNMGQYSTALSYYEKALEIRQRTLPANHLSLADSYNNMAYVYESMKNYFKALSYFDRALNIRQRLLPPSHPSIQDVHKSIEMVKEKMN